MGNRITDQRDLPSQVSSRIGFWFLRCNLFGTFLPRGKVHVLGDVAESFAILNPTGSVLFARELALLLLPSSADLQLDTGQGRHLQLLERC